jgi:hypothetical protein
LKPDEGTAVRDVAPLGTFEMDVPLDVNAGLGFAW